jgi:hypothetical protein
MSHGSYDLKLVSKRLILVGDIRSRSWPNIGDSYGTEYSVRLKPLFWFRSDTETETQIGRYFRPIP